MVSFVTFSNTRYRNENKKAFSLECLEYNMKGLYILYGLEEDNSVPLYVGETTDVRKRLSQHLDKSGKFCNEIMRIKILPITHVHEKSLRVELEGFLIDLLKPKYNLTKSGIDIRVFDELIELNKRR